MNKEQSKNNQQSPYKEPPEGQPLRLSGALLFESMQAIDENLLIRSEIKPRFRNTSVRAKFGAAAACLCIAAASIFTVSGMLSGPKVGSGINVPEPDRAGSDVVPGGHTAGQETGLNAEGAERTQEAVLPDAVLHAADTWTISYNPVSLILIADTALKINSPLFKEALTEEELTFLSPTLLNGMECSGTALYYGSTELAQVQLEITGSSFPSPVSVTFMETDKADFGVDYVLPEEEAVTTSFGDFTFTAYRYQPENADSVSLWADFEKDSIYYSVQIRSTAAELEQAEAALHDVMLCYAGTATSPDLSRLSMKGDYEWIDRPLTLDEAKNDADFGDLMLTQLPEGFSEESIRRYKDQNFDYLSGLWTSGYDSLQWQVSYPGEQDRKRMTSIADTKNYDLTLYPIPRADSVPEELREIVDNPIFQLEELTLDVVYARAYRVNDTGDSSGYRMDFSVLCSDRLIEIRTKGVSPEWVYEQLQGLK